MATGWVLNKVSEALAPTVSNIVSNVGGVAGDVVCSVGNSINGVGDSISGVIHRYGNAAKDTGNGLKDFTGAPGGRLTTASNPLGLTDTKDGGRRAITSPSLPKAIDRKPAVSTSFQKALPAPRPAPPQSNTTATDKSKTASRNPRPASLNITKSSAPPSTGKALGSAKGFASSPVNNMSPNKSPSTPAKKTPSKVTYSARPKATGSTAEARNPLGL